MKYFIFLTVLFLAACGKDSSTALNPIATFRYVAKNEWSIPPGNTTTNDFFVASVFTDGESAKTYPDVMRISSAGLEGFENRLSRSQAGFANSAQLTSGNFSAMTLSNSRWLAYDSGPDQITSLARVSDGQFSKTRVNFEAGPVLSLASLSNGTFLTVVTTAQHHLRQSNGASLTSPSLPGDAGVKALSGVVLTSGAESLILVGNSNAYFLIGSGINFQLYRDSIVRPAGAGVIVDAALVDVTRDGKNDLVLLTQNTVEIYQNNSTASLLAWVPLTAKFNVPFSRAKKLFFRDLNRDGGLDVIVTSMQEKPQIYLAASATSYVDAKNALFGASVDALFPSRHVLFATTADLNQDGIPEVLFASDQGAVAAYFQEGTP